MLVSCNLKLFFYALYATLIDWRYFILNTKYAENLILSRKNFKYQKRQCGSLLIKHFDRLFKTR